MARRLTLSPSKITCYLACPHKYWWTFESPQGQWFLRARSYYSFGLSLHRALEQFHQSGQTGIETADTLIAAFEEHWLEAGYSSAEEMQAAFGEGKEILARYAEEHAAAQAESNVLFVEKSLRKNMGEWDLIGRADRIDQRADGTIMISDYKSGRLSVSESEVQNDVAMAAYALMVRDLYPDSPIGAQIIPLRNPSEGAEHLFSPEEFSEIEFVLREVGDRMRNHFWEEIHPKPKRLCKGCDFVTLCRRDPEYAEEMALLVERGEG